MASQEGSQVETAERIAERRHDHSSEGRSEYSEEENSARSSAEQSVIRT